MKRIYSKIFMSLVASALMALQAVTFTACNDDMAAENYYTFTGEMMSDYLNNRENMSLMKRIVERADKMKYLSSIHVKGTFFPPVNSGIEQYLEENGYASVEDIPVAYCDTIVKVHLIEHARVFTSNLASESQYTNSLDLPLIIKSTGEVVDENGLALSIINNSASIINELKNDTVENGVVHPVTNVIVPNTSMGGDLLDANYQQAGFSIFYEALVRTGLIDSLRYYMDEDYEINKNNYPEFRKKIYSGGVFNASDTGYEYTAKRPDHRKFGYTIYVVPDEVLYEKYAEYCSPEKTMDENIEGLYKLAVERYNDELFKQIQGITAEDVEKYWNSAEGNLKERKNPLNMFMSYHILDRLYTSRDIMLNCWGTNSGYTNPTEWIGTLLDHSLLKIEKVYNRESERDVDFHAELYLNHSTPSIYNGYNKIRGAHISDPNVSANFSLNCSFFFIDEVLAFDQTTRNNVMNTRIRTDFVTLFPELTTNNMRLHGNYREAYTGKDNNEIGENGFNYYAPPGYLKDVEFNEDAIFFIQRPKMQWWNWGGDEINILGASYDVTIKLPSVPPGSYEVRIGYPGMIDRGIAQIYVDDIPQGLPLDMRYQANDSRVAGIYAGGVAETVTLWNGLTEEERQENMRTMKNNGYYRGPASIYMAFGSWANNHPSPADPPTGNADYANYNRYTYRRKVCDLQVVPGKEHTIRFRSVYTLGNKGCFVLDYLEMVPIEIAGAGGLGEDIY